MPLYAISLDVVVYPSVRGVAKHSQLIHSPPPPRIASYILNRDSMRLAYHATRLADRLSRLNAEEGRKTSMALTKATAYAPQEAQEQMAA